MTSSQPKLTASTAAPIMGGPRRDSFCGHENLIGRDQHFECRECALAELRKNRVKQKLEQGEVASIVSGQNTANMIEPNIAKINCATSVKMTLGRPPKVA